MVTKFRSNLSVCVAQANPILITRTLFDAHYKESIESPIEEFLNRLSVLNKLAPPPITFDPFQGQLVLLGVIAAVESFIRTIFRKIITLDNDSQIKVYKEDVSFGAALHLSKDLLPEAILERRSFISKLSISESLRDLLAVKGVLPSDLEKSIEDYVRVCQLRHCTVHRFGKLGTSNAIALGLVDHIKLLEKPLKLDYVALQNTIAISTGLVKTLNNFLFNEILSRVPSHEWKGVYKNDRYLFMQYYSLFCDKVSSNKTVQPSILYRQLFDQRFTWINSGKPI